MKREKKKKVELLHKVRRRTFEKEQLLGLLDKEESERSCGKKEVTQLTSEVEQLDALHNGIGSFACFRFA